MVSSVNFSAFIRSKEMANRNGNEILVGRKMTILVYKVAKQIKLSIQLAVAIVVVPNTPNPFWKTAKERSKHPNKEINQGSCRPTSV